MSPQSHISEATNLHFILTSKSFTYIKKEFLNFLADVTDKILLYAIISRGVTRALRLKLVCSKEYSLQNPEAADEDP
ncbi:hypothetical protein IFR05_001089 [Cadophora sp. M221]|nr:hypothetical protein IFR05_001089 [Cadophora sp. M221]